MPTLIIERLGKYRMIYSSIHYTTETHYHGRYKYLKKGSPVKSGRIVNVETLEWLYATSSLQKLRRKWRKFCRNVVRLELEQGA